MRKMLIGLVLISALFAQTHGTETILNGLVTNADITYVDTFWEDLRVPAQNTKLNPTKSEPAFESFIGGTFAYAFDTGNNNDKSVHFIAQIPHEYKHGTDLSPHVHWSPSNTNTNNVVFELEYTIISINGTFGSTTSDTITVPGDGTAYKHQLDDFADISGSGITGSAIIVARLTRLGDEVTDDFTGIAYFLEFDYHYQIDKPGSDNETP